MQQVDQDFVVRSVGCWGGLKVGSTAPAWMNAS